VAADAVWYQLADMEFDGCESEVGSVGPSSGTSSNGASPASDFSTATDDSPRSAVSKQGN